MNHLLGYINDKEPRAAPGIKKYKKKLQVSLKPTRCFHHYKDFTQIQSHKLNSILVNVASVDYDDEFYLSTTHFYAQHK